MDGGRWDGVSVDIANVDCREEKDREPAYPSEKLDQALRAKQKWSQDSINAKNKGTYDLLDHSR